MSLVTYLKSLVRTIGKEDLFEDIRITKKELSDKLIPLYTDAATYFASHTMKSGHVTSLNGEFMRTAGKGEGHKNMFSYIAAALPKILSNLDVLADAIDKSLDTKLVTEAASLRQAMLIKDLDLISFASNYSFRLLTFVYKMEGDEIKASSFDDLNMPPPLVKMIITNIFTYARILKTFGVSSEKFYTNLMDLRDIPLDANSIEAMKTLEENSLIKELDTLTPVGFEGNPIFHFRLMIAEWQANRYKLNQETKQYLELKLMTLKMANEKTSDPKIEKEIEYIASRIDKLTYAMAKAEKKVGGLD